MSTRTGMAAGDMVTFLEIGPSGLDRYLDLVGDRRGPLIKYHDGSLTLVSPSLRHEQDATRLDYLVTSICEGLEIDFLPTASTLFRHPNFDHGIEADKSYYIQNEPAVRAVAEAIDLTILPPPDLMIEVVVSPGPKKALRISRELRVPEVWVDCPEKNQLVFLRLATRGPEFGTYVPSETSRAFPFLKRAEVEPWLRVAEGEREIAWRGRVREWVRAELAPRRQAGGEGIEN